FITSKDLAGGKCKIHQKEPEIIEEENYFFKLSKYSKEIGKAIEEDKTRIIPDGRKNEMMSFINQGLEDVSFSRPRKDLKWGIPVPGDESQTIYVWADALVNYLSALGYPDDNFKKYWPPDVHCLGKDILRFHATIWLGMLLSMKLPLPKNIFVHGFITSSGQKMSKSLGNVVDPFELVKKYGTDSVRYFLLREITSMEDGDFTYEKFEQRYTSDLAKGLGNLVSRVATLAKKHSFPSDISAKGQVQKEINSAQEKYKKSLADFKFNEALISVWGLIGFCDRYIEKEKPWENKENAEEVIINLLFAVKEIARLLEPFLPQSSKKAADQLKSEEIKALFPRI
ncbi:MAG: methionine--tRNA ligase, partial [Parcubacteria group bacterium]